MRLEIGQKVYRVRYRGRFVLFMVMLTALCILLGYCISGVGMVRTGQDGECAQPVRSLEWLAPELTGNR